MSSIVTNSVVCHRTKELEDMFKVIYCNMFITLKMIKFQDDRNNISKEITFYVQGYITG